MVTTGDLLRQPIGRIFALVAAVSVLLLVLLFVLDVKQNIFGFEVAKALIQLLVVVVIGGLVSLGTFNYQRHRDTRRDLQQRSDELLRLVLEDAVTGYHSVKRA